MDQPPRELRLGKKTIFATTATLLSRHRPIYRLKVKQSSLLSIIGLLFPRIKARWPGWFLPAEIIVKKMKEGWEQEFRTEIATYKYLRPIQGIIIPRFYGEAIYDGSPALVVAVVDGITLSQVARAIYTQHHYPIANLRGQIEEALYTLWQYGVEYLDGKLDNLFLLKDGRIMVIDLELVFLCTTKEWQETENYEAVDYLMVDFETKKQMYLTS
ncbi:uncharacterized protein BDV17DRAFT_270997 [Aspergillus undulatus]|uniref:uncharacterized protein n=1 Tax=Aspergillus undulatus TaxID=1810928 RepID=UPI003CCD8077